MKRIIHNFYFSLNRRESIQNKLWLLRALALSNDECQRDLRVFSNTIPKSGTHLLTRCLNLMPCLRNSGYFVNHLRNDNSRQDIAKVERILTRINNGYFVSAHMPYSEQNALRLKRMGYRHILLVRDPRDVIVSQLLFMMKRPSNRWYQDFLEMDNNHIRLLALIRGVEASALRSHIEIPNVDKSMRSFVRWIGQGVYVVRFEDMVGESGGGSSARQVEAVTGIAEYLALSLTTEELCSIADQLFSRKSNTFRKGMIGDWRNHFGEEQKRTFKEIAGQLLIDLGYEKNLDW